MYAEYFAGNQQFDAEFRFTFTPEDAAEYTFFLVCREVSREGWPEPEEHEVW